MPADEKEVSFLISDKELKKTEEAFRIFAENELPISTNVNAFIKYKEQVNSCLIHYGNAEDRDYMKGEDIVAVGRPHYNATAYKLIAYENPQLRDIHSGH